MTDRTLGIIILLISIFYIYATSIIQISFISDTIGPKGFPYIIAFFLFGSSIWLIFFPKFQATWPKTKKIIEVLATAAIFFLYAFVLPYLGFVTSTILLTTYISWKMGAVILIAFIYGIIISITIFILFNYVLGLSLAKNYLGF